MFHVGMHSYSKLPVEQAIMGLLSTFTANLSLMAIGLLQAPSTIILDCVPAVYLEYDCIRWIPRVHACATSCNQEDSISLLHGCESMVSWRVNYS